MSLIHRHLTWELFKTSLAAVVLFSFILIAGNAIKEVLAYLLDGRISFGVFVQLLGLLLPYVVSYALPLGALMGVLLTFGQMCGRGEFTAYRSCGISLAYLSAPFLFFAIVGVILMSVINFYYAPNARSSYFEMLGSMVRSDPLRFVVPKTFIKEFPGYVLYARERSGNSLKDFWIWELDKHNRPIKLIRSKEGRLNYNTENDSLRLELVGGFSELRDPKKPDDLRTIRPSLSFDQADVTLGLNRLVSGEQRGGLTTLTLDGLLERKHQMAADLRAEPDNTKLAEDFSALKFQIQQNFSFAFSVLSLTLLGIPLSLKVQRSEKGANLALALGLAFVYYFLLVVTSWFSRYPALHPELLVWIPNLIFQALGIVLFVRAARS